MIREPKQPSESGGSFDYFRKTAEHVRQRMPAIGAGGMITTQGYIPGKVQGASTFGLSASMYMVSLVKSETLVCRAVAKKANGKWTIGNTPVFVDLPVEFRQSFYTGVSNGTPQTNGDSTYGFPTLNVLTNSYRQLRSIQRGTLETIQEITPNYVAALPFSTDVAPFLPEPAAEYDTLPGSLIWAGSIGGRLTDLNLSGRTWAINDGLVQCLIVGINPDYTVACRALNMNANGAGFTLGDSFDVMLPWSLRPESWDGIAGVVANGQTWEADNWGDGEQKRIMTAGGSGSQVITPPYSAYNKISLSNNTTYVYAGVPNPLSVLYARPVDTSRVPATNADASGLELRFVDVNADARKWSASAVESGSGLFKVVTVGADYYQARKCTNLLLQEFDAELTYIKHAPGIVNTTTAWTNNGWTQQGHSRSAPIIGGITPNPTSYVEAEEIWKWQVGDLIVATNLGVPLFTYPPNGIGTWIDVTPTPHFSNAIRRALNYCDGNGNPAQTTVL